MNSIALGNYETNNRESNYQSIIQQSPNINYTFKDTLIGFESNPDVPDYDNSIEENLHIDIMDMPTKNQSVYTTQVANVQADNAPYIDTNPDLNKELTQQVYDKPWGGDKQIRLQDPNDNYGGGDAKVQMNILSKESQLVDTLNQAKILNQSAIQKQQTEVRPVNLDWANAEDPEYEQKRHIFKNSIDQYLNDQSYINYMNNPNNKDSSIKKERAEQYAVKPVATSAVVRRPTAMYKKNQNHMVLQNNALGTGFPLKNQRITLFVNNSKIALPQRIINLQSQGNLRKIDQQGTATYKPNNSQMNIFGMTTPQSVIATQNDLPPIEYD